jgi:3-hydroxyisobutyrate dehydrogenase
VIEIETLRVGVIGLGRMGLPICARLANRGLPVTATDIDIGRRPAAVSAGAAWLPEAREVAAAADVVITVLPGTTEVESVTAAVVGGMAPGAVWIDMSTASPRVQRPGGVRAVDAPVGGGPEAAREGRLLTFVGALAEDLEAARPVLEVVADRIIHVGPPGSGYTLKLLANALWFGQAVAVAEVLTLAERAGIDPETARAGLAQSAAASQFIERDARSLLTGDDLTSFALTRCCEQLETVLALAEELAVPVELASVVDEVHRRALAHYGEVDGELLAARLVAERAGVRFTSGTDRR